MLFSEASTNGRPVVVVVVVVVYVKVVCVVAVVLVAVVVKGTNDVHVVCTPWFRHDCCPVLRPHMPQVCGQNASKHCWKSDQSR